MMLFGTIFHKSQIQPPKNNPQPNQCRGGFVTHPKPLEQFRESDRLQAVIRQNLEKLGYGE
jgi:hypothetical protein